MITDIGDIVSEDLVENFMNVLPPRAMSYGDLQMGEPYSHVYESTTDLEEST